MEQYEKRQGVFIAVATGEQYSYGLSLLAKLRGAGIRSEASLRLNKLAKQLATADKKLYQFAVVIGSQEAESESFTAKNLEIGEQTQNLSSSDLLDLVSET